MLSLLLFPHPDRLHLFQYPLRAVDDRVIDEFTVELDCRAALGLRSGEGGDDPLR